jgi:hypothetical protein
MQGDRPPDLIRHAWNCSRPPAQDHEPYDWPGAQDQRIREVIRAAAVALGLMEP